MKAETERQRRLVLVRWLPAIVVMTGIFLASSVSGLRVTDEPQVDRPLRALGHLATYACLAAFVLYALVGRRRPGWRDIVAAFLITLAYGLADELHQSLVPDRNGRLADVLVDGAGALVGLVVAWLVLARRPGGAPKVERATRPGSGPPRAASGG
jgi:VanZ family protein